MALLSIYTFLLLLTLSDTASVQYDENLAKKFVAMAAAAYSPTPAACLSAAFPAQENWTLATNTNNKCDFLKDTCAVAIAISDNNKQISVAFRGTTTKDQLLLESLESTEAKEDFNGLGNVNRYFKDGLKDVWSNVNSALTANQTKSYAVIFSGHSLGGALASLAAAQTVKLGIRQPNQVKLFTYGEPRVGDSTYAFNHDQLVPYSFRIVHQADIVPHVPKCKMDKSNKCEAGGKSYYHHGTEVWYSNGMGPGANYSVCTGLPTDEDITCSDSLHSKAGYTTSDHYIYFNYDVSRYGKDGCTDKPNPTRAPSNESEFLQLRNSLLNRLQHYLTGK